MLELTTVRKHKVSLADYDYKRDIENRLLLSRLTVDEHAVIEEILFSPIRTTLRKIAKNIDLQEDTVFAILQKLAKTGLISFEEEAVVVDKETRKYFETELEKFEDDFQAGMEFLQHLLKKVPIHVLPHWYAIPRTSNNIFESLIEKYLLTPNIYQRYLMDLNFPDPTLNAIAQDVLKAPGFEVIAQEIQKKYKLTPEKFQEALLTLEFHFVCTLAYRKQEDHWIEVVTLFEEWKEHLLFLKNTTPSTLSKKVEREHSSDFAFVEDLTAALQKSETLTGKLLLKAQKTQLAEIHGGKPILTTTGREWLDLSPENKALYLYRQVQGNEKVIREVEKSILRITHLGWVLLEDFLKGVYVPTSEGQSVALKKMGKHWKYQRPLYTPEDLYLIETTVLEHLFEAGITALGTYEGQRCICVTPFGQSLFG